MAQYSCPQLVFERVAYGVKSKWVIRYVVQTSCVRGLDKMIHPPCCLYDASYEIKSMLLICSWFEWTINQGIGSVRSYIQTKILPIPTSHLLVRTRCHNINNWIMILNLLKCPFSLSRILSASLGGYCPFWSFRAFGRFPHHFQATGCSFIVLELHFLLLI